MTPKTQPTTLQLARAYIQHQANMLRLDEAEATLESNIIDPDTMRQAYDILREARRRAGSDYIHAERAYLERIGSIRSKVYLHLSNLQDIAGHRR